MMGSETNNTDRYPHSHPELSKNLGVPETALVSSELMSAQIIDFQRYLQNQTTESPSSETFRASTEELQLPPKTLAEKRLDSIFAVVIGSVITAAILPMTSSIENPKFQDGASVGVISFVGWGVFYASIPYLQDSKFNRFSFKKKTIA